MTKFHEGQEVEVALGNRRWEDGRYWRKTKIVLLPHAPNSLDAGRCYTVQFPDGTRAVFDEEQIRAAEPLRATWIEKPGEYGAD